MSMQAQPPSTPQCDGYSRYHRARRNLVIHIVAVPLFLLGNVALVLGLAQGRWLGAAAGLALTLVSLAAQGLGHRIEPDPPAAFAGPVDAVRRILVEQWVSFPRFVLSGRWRRAMQHAPAPRRR